MTMLMGEPLDAACNTAALLYFPGCWPVKTIKYVRYADVAASFYSSHTVK